MIIKAEFGAGTSISQACREAQWFADDNGVSVEFDFNGVTCLARNGGSRFWLEENQQREQSRSLDGPRDVRFASSIDRPAKAIEAGTGETQSGSTVGESAVAEGDAP